MADVGLDELSLYGLGYELWRINPDGDAKQIITGVGDHVSPFGRFVEKRVSIVDADWNLRIGVAGKWYDAPEIRAMIPVALLISFLVAFLMQKRFDLKAMKKLKHMAYIDSLTEVFNRRCFMELASLRIEMLKRTKEFGFLIIFDLDNFKKINDTYGHLAGDEVLRVIPGRIKMCIRPYDLMARYGGDEFIMFITCADATDIADVVERCRRSIAGKPVEFEDKNIPVTASFGVAAFSPDLDLKTAMKFADEALYGAKKKGRNICDMHGNCELLPLYSGHG
ncbi:MAG: GGDEF domain-containing protein [Desulfovibrio sp.]|nr:GGDEF domain-containing protein [Desulfovibrio sp.]